MTPSPLRLGVVGYLNAAPLVHGLARDPRFVLVRDVPSRVADRLRAGEVDLGMIPSVEYAAGDYAVAPGLAIGSQGAVRSVRLFHRVPLDKVRRVAVDTSTRTSVALLRVLLRERLGREPEYVAHAPSVDAMLSSNDAALVIGDPALYYEGEVPSLDLGEEWTALTGMPFVYAFWAGRPGVLKDEDVARLQEALRQGLSEIPAIAASYSTASHRSRVAQNEAYLRFHVTYTLGDAEQAGLHEFYRRAFSLGLIPSVPELRFYGHR